MLLLAPLLATLVPLPSQVALPPASPLEVRGVIHGTLRARLVTESGAPVAGASVACLSQAPGWGGSLQLVGATTSDTDGEVLFEDLLTDHPVHLVVRPGPELRPRALGVPGICAGTVDLGELELERNLRLTGRVLLADGTTLRGDKFYIRLVTRDVDEDNVAFDQLDEGAFSLEDFPRVPLWIEVKRNTDWSASNLRLAWDPDPEALQLELVLRVAEDALELESLNPITRDPQAETPRRFEGRVTLPGGGPAVGLPVELQGRTIFERALEPEARGVTDAEGRFALRTHDEALDRVLVLHPGGARSVTGGLDNKLRSLEEWGEPAQSLDRLELQVELSVAHSLWLEVSGVEREQVDWAFRAGEAWYDVSEELAAFVPAEGARGRVLRASARGHAPRIASFTARTEKAVFDFGGDVPHALVVLGAAGKQSPRTDAVVDLLLRGGSEGRSVPVDVRLGTYPVDGEGRLALVAGTDQLLFARVTAPGHDPALVRFAPGTTKVRLTPRDRHLSLSEVSAGTVLRVKPAGRDGLVAFVRVREDGDRELAVGSGAKFEVSTTNPDGTPGATWNCSTTDAVNRVGSEDVRPRVLLTLPELPPVPEDDRRWYADESSDPAVDRWWAWAQRNGLMGGGAGAMASSSSGSYTADEQPAVVTELDDGRFELVLAGSGPWTILAGSYRTSLEADFFCEVELAPGELLELELPPVDAELVASTSGFGSGSYDTHHGVAGPRLELLPVPSAAPGWGATIRLPDLVKGEPNFRVRALPAGEYLLRHHLTANSEAPLGARRITIGAGAVPVPDLEQWPAGTFRVSVVDRAGEPVTAARLTVRDRLAEAWLAYTRQPSTGTFASRGLPAPPAFRLEGESVRFPEVQTGWMEFRVEADDGRRWSFLREVEPGGEVELRLTD